MTNLPLPESWHRRRITSNGVTLAVTEAGPPDGPLVFLLHGFPGFWYCWRKQIDSLTTAGFRVVVPDQRGYDTSDKPQGVAAYAIDRLADDIVGLADALGQARFAVIGHDWGGLVAWWLALREPDWVERLVTINAPHPVVMRRHLMSDPGQMMRSLYIGFFQMPWLPEAMLSARGFRAMKQALVQSSRPGTFTTDELEHYRNAWTQPGALTAMINWYRAMRHRANPPAETVRAPTMVIWGRRDKFLKEKLAEEGAALCQDGRVAYLDEGTHWVHLEEPDAVNTLLVNFLASEPSRPAGR